MKNRILMLFLFSLAIFCMFMQCNDKLIVDVAKTELLENEFLVKEYKVKLDVQKVDQPLPVAEFTFNADSLKHYRFRIVSDKENFDGEGVLKLLADNKIIGSSYNEKNKKNFVFFDLITSGDTKYQLIVNFLDGKAGRALLIVSEIIPAGISKKVFSENEVLLKEYRIRLNSNKPVAELFQQLDNGKSYRFRIADRKEKSGSKTILSLSDGDIKLGSTYSEELDKYNSMFDFNCSKSGNYKLLITFQAGKASHTVIYVLINELLPIHKKKRK